MTSVRKKNGYVLVPSLDPDEPDVNHTKRKAKSHPPDLKPGLFVQFSTDRRVNQHQVSESEEIELKDLKPRRKPRKLKSPKSPSDKIRQHHKVVEEPVLEGDTIQRISLRYSCPVSELRRINKLYSDLDLHALKTIKIPVKEHSLLLEATEREKRRELVSGNNGTPSSGATSNDEVHFGGRNTYYTSDDNQSHEEEEDDADDEYGGDSDTPEYRDISLQSALKWKHNRQTLLEKLDEDLKKAKTTVENQKSNVKEVRLIFESPSVHPISVQEYTKQVLELPDWRILAVTSILIFIIILVGIVVYFKWYKTDDTSLL